MAFFEREMQEERIGLTAEKRVRVSQCMIVKNEEANIERALSWGKGFVWEQIVVDTGSTDRTTALAEKYGAAVYHFDWIDDFAAAKNFAIEKAKGEWIAFLDADEFLTSDHVSKLSAILQGGACLRYDGITTGWLQLDDNGNVFSGGTQVRFFRNLPTLRYRRRIHEQLGFTDGREMRLGDISREVAVLHDGYHGIAYENKKKSGRNYQLILKELSDNPLDYEMTGYMGDEYQSNGETEEAARWYWKSIQLMPEAVPESDQRSAVTFTRMLKIITEQFPQRVDDIQEIFDKGTKLVPWEADLNYIMARYCMVVGDYKKARSYMIQALDKMDRFGCTGRAMMLSVNQDDAWGILAACSYHLCQYQEAVEYAVTVLKNWRYSMQTLCILITVLIKDEKNQEAAAAAIEEFLEGLYDFSALKDKLFVWKAAQKAGAVSLVTRIYNRFLPEELACLNIKRER